MRSLSGILVVSSIALVMSFATSGCTTAKKVQTPAAEKFEADSTMVILDAKDKSVTITFNKDVSSVSESKDGVTAVRDGNKVVFTQTADAPNEEKKFDFVVKGGDDESVTVTITLARRTSRNDDNLVSQQPDQPAAPVEPFVLDDDGKLAVKLDTSVKKNTRVWVKARTGTIVGVSAPPEKSKVTWRLDSGKKAVEITVAKDATEKDAKEYAMHVGGKDSAGNPATATVKFKLAAEPLVLEVDGSLEVKLDLKANKDTQVWVKARSGTVFGVTNLSTSSIVTWEYDADKQAIGITVAKEAGIDDAKEYVIQVRGKDSVGKRTTVELKFKVTGN